MKRLVIVGLFAVTLLLGIAVSNASAHTAPASASLLNTHGSVVAQIPGTVGHATVGGVGGQNAVDTVQFVRAANIVGVTGGPMSSSGCITGDSCRSPVTTQAFGR